MHEASPNLTTAAIDATGHYKINVQISVPAGTSPGDTFQFNTQNLDSPRQNTDSQAMPFKVSCATPPGGDISLTNAGKGLTNNINQSLIFANSAPTNVRIITDPNDSACDAFCKSAISNEGLSIVFNYADAKSVDGYRLHDSNSTKNFAVLVPVAASNSSALQFWVRKPATGDFSGMCFHVTAFKGSAESAASPDVCASSTSSLHTVTLTPRRIRTELVGGGAAAFNQTYNTGVTIALVGVSNDGNQSYNAYYRMALFYDVSALNGHAVTGAQLLLHSHPLFGPDPNETGQCGTQMVPAKNAWWQGTPGIALDPPSAITFSNSMPPWKTNGSGGIGGLEPTAVNPATIDITPFVKEWISHPQFNYGIVIKQPDENSSEDNSDYCVSQYDRFDLTVTYR